MTPRNKICNKHFVLNVLLVVGLYDTFEIKQNCFLIWHTIMLFDQIIIDASLLLRLYKIGIG